MEPDREFHGGDVDRFGCPHGKLVQAIGDVLRGVVGQSGCGISAVEIVPLIPAIDSDLRTKVRPAGLEWIDFKHGLKGLEFYENCGNVPKRAIGIASSELNVMAKTICDWSKKELEAHPEKLYELVRNPRFYCRKCGRVANTKKVLCNAKDFPASATENGEST